MWHGLLLISKLIGFAGAADKEGESVLLGPFHFSRQKKRYDEDDSIAATNERAGSLFAPTRASALTLHEPAYWPWR